MGKWAERLESHLAEEKSSHPPTEALTKPTKGASVSFGSDPEGGCEEISPAANDPAPAEPGAFAADSQEFAALRNPGNRPQREHSCGSSQDSQDSQGSGPACASATANDPASADPRPYRLTKTEGDAAHTEPWNDAACARFVARVSLFLRRGINATDADDLAERLHLRDVQGDDRRLCLECSGLIGRPGAWRCGNQRRAGVGRDLPAAIVMQPQRCPGFVEVPT